MKNLFLTIIAAASLTLSGCGLNTPSNGEKIGQLVRVNKSGIFVDTWEAQIIRGGMASGSGVVGVQPFDFTIENEAVAKQLQEYMEQQTEIKITYRTEGVYSVFRSNSSGHFLKSVEVLAKEKTDSGSFEERVEAEVRRRILKAFSIKE